MLLYELKYLFETIARLSVHGYGWRECRKPKCDTVFVLTVGSDKPPTTYTISSVSPYGMPMAYCIRKLL